MSAVIGVLGGSGGVGASTFAAVLAASAGPATLVDLDPVGGGIDVLLAIEDVPGARWSGIRLSGGYLDPAVLAQGLPRFGDVAVLAADVAPPSVEAVGQVIAAAACEGVVVVDLPRAPSATRDAAVAGCKLCVVVVVAELRALVAAASVLRTIEEVPAGVVLRRGGLSTTEALALLDAPLLGVLPRSEHAPGQRAPRPARVADRIARGIWHGLGVRPADGGPGSHHGGAAA